MSSPNTKEYQELKKMFLEDAAENISGLEKQIQTLEKNKDDSAALLELYRILHTFKGSSGTVGLTELEKMFHELESFVNGIREKKTEINQKVIDLLYESLDVIENTINRVRDNGDFSSIAKTFTDKIQSFKKDGSSGSADSDKKSRMKELFNQFGLEEFKPDPSVFSDISKKFYNITIWLEDNIRLKTARLYVIIKNIGNMGVIVKTEPSFIELLDGKFENEIKIVFHSAKEKNLLENSIKASGEIEKIEIEELNQDAVKKEISSIGAEKEQEKETAILESTTQVNSVNIELPVLDQLLELFGELLIRAKQLEHRIEGKTDSETKEILFQMQNFMFILQDIVLQMQLVPISTMFRLYPRMVRGLAQREGKRVRLVLHHNDIKLDRKMLNQTGEIINHLLRNSVYHGIENESDRRALKKNVEGLIRLETKIENNVLLITIEDDGNGIDPDKIARVAIEKGLYTVEEIQNMKKEDIQKIVFKSNFSTANSANLTSGRGLGLSIVKQKVEMLGGFLDFVSEAKMGTKFIIQIPISRSIIRALIVQSGLQSYSIALDDVQELYEFKTSDISSINNQEYVILTDQKDLLKIYRLNQLFKIEQPGDSEQIQTDTLKIVHIKKGDRNYGLVVDEFIKESEIVIKKISDGHEIKGISGAAVLDDGTVSLIIDPFSVVM